VRHLHHTIVDGVQRRDFASKRLHDKGCHSVAHIAANFSYDLRNDRVLCSPVDNLWTRSILHSLCVLLSELTWLAIASTLVSGIGKSSDGILIIFDLSCYLCRIWRERFLVVCVWIQRNGLCESQFSYRDIGKQKKWRWWGKFRHSICPALNTHSKHIATFRPLCLKNGFSCWSYSFVLFSSAGNWHRLGVS